MKGTNWHRHKSLSSIFFCFRILENIGCWHIESFLKYNILIQVFLFCFGKAVGGYSQDRAACGHMIVIYQIKSAWIFWNRSFLWTYICKGEKCIRLMHLLSQTVETRLGIKCLFQYENVSCVSEATVGKYALIVMTSIAKRAILIC